MRIIMLSESCLEINFIWNESKVEGLVIRQDKVFPVDSVDVPFGDGFPWFPAAEDPDSVDESPFELEGEDFKVPEKLQFNIIVGSLEVVRESGGWVGFYSDDRS